MKNLKFLFFLILSFLCGAALAQQSELPSSERMRELKPEPNKRLQIYDTLFFSTARTAEEAHQRYTDPAVLADVEERLHRVRETGDPKDIFTSEERAQYDLNMQELRLLEAGFFERWYLKAPMTIAIRFQKWLTLKNSPLPQAKEHEATVVRLREAAQSNILYSNWNKELPQSLLVVGGPQTWGELLLRFNSNSQFRQYWIKNHTSSLPFLKSLYEVWAWEDTSVRSVTVRNFDTPQEYWVLTLKDRERVPNRFWLNIQGDFSGLVSLEYAPTLFFNRVTKVIKKSRVVHYVIDAVEKGRTMELASTVNENGTSKQTFRGSELLRKTKADEFLQRNYIQRGSLNLFLGLRTLQLNQIQELMRVHPELVAAVGQFGLSITGGQAQTVSNRTDSPDQQLLKLTATLIDFIEFAKTKDVKTWFKLNTAHVLRTILGGVGSGGSKALKEPTSANQTTSSVSAVRSCRAIFELRAVN